MTDRIESKVVFQRIVRQLRNRGARAPRHDDGLATIVGHDCLALLGGHVGAHQLRAPRCSRLHSIDPSWRVYCNHSGHARTSKPVRCRPAILQRVPHTRGLEARLSTRSAHGHYWITITGRLCGRDLGRLERACGHALEHSLLPLTVRLAGVDTIDSTAQAFLNRPAHRGALLVFEPPRREDR